MTRFGNKHLVNKEKRAYKQLPHDKRHHMSLQLPNPHLRRWMLFVDGENFTIRAQNLARAKNIVLKQGPQYQRDIFVWFPGVHPIVDLIENNTLQERAIRAYYYTSVFGDDQLVASVKNSLWKLGFQPEVFKKKRKGDKAKGVDIALTKDVLSHTFLDNYDVAVLIAGDGDYVPLIQEVKRLGKLVYLLFFEEEGLSPELRLESDDFIDLTRTFARTWERPILTT